MSKLNDLIREYCPDGVEYKKLDEIATITRGGNFQKKDFLDEGIPCIHYGQIYTKYNLFVDQTLSYISKEKSQKQKFAEPGDVIMAVTSENIEDVCKCVAWLGSEKLAVSGHTAIIHHNLNPKYLVYYLSSEAFYKQKLKLVHGTKVIEVTPKSLENVLIPVPPLPVQREIVRILDNFTELTAELTAREKQYEYYRDRLLTFDENNPIARKYCPDGVEYLPLWQLFNTRNGYTPAKKHIEYWRGGTFPWFRMEDIREHGRILFDSIQHVTEQAIKGDPFPKDSIIISTSATIGEHALIRKPFLVNQRFTVLMIRKEFKEKFNNKFLFYYCFKLDDFCNSHLNTSSFNSVDKTAFNNFLFAVPPLPVQREIVQMLDRFDKLCHDMTTGLPAEIEARQKQYAYYRDKLLDFKPLES